MPPRSRSAQTPGGTAQRSPEMPHPERRTCRDFQARPAGPNSSSAIRVQHQNSAPLLVLLQTLSLPIYRRSAHAPSSFPSSKPSAPSTTRSSAPKRPAALPTASPAEQPPRTALPSDSPTAPLPALPSHAKLVKKPRRPTSLLTTRAEHQQSRAVQRPDPWAQFGWEQEYLGLTAEDLTQLTDERPPAQQQQQHDLSRRHSSNSISSTTPSIASVDVETGSLVAEPASATTQDKRAAAAKFLSVPLADDIGHSLFTVEERETEEDYVDWTEEDDQDEMGLVRSLTQRFSRSSSGSDSSPPSSPSRSIPERKRPNISLPHLIHTTNHFVNETGDIFSGSSNHSSSSTAPSTPTGTPALTNSSRSSTDNTPLEQKFSIAPNHLTQYFSAADNKAPPAVTVLPVSPASTISDDEPTALPPAIPQRAPSHSKREHVRLARVRSIRSSRASGMSVSASGSPSPPSSPGHRRWSFNSEPEQLHPFGPELAQLDRVRDDYNSMMLERVPEEEDEDERVFSQGKFRRITPSVYMTELVDMENARWCD